MNQGELLAAKSFAWVLVTALCWTYAAYGYSSTPRFDKWFWGIGFAFNVIALVIAVFSLHAGEASR